MPGNSMSKHEYIFEVVFWCVIAFIWYNKLFFYNLMNRTFGESIVVLISIVVVVIVFNTIMNLNWHRSYMSVCLTVLLPFGIYTYLAYVNYISVIYNVIAFISVGSIVSITGYILSKKTNIKNKRKKILAKTRRIYLISGAIGTIASIMIIGCLALRLYVLGGIVLPSENDNSKYESIEYTITNNIDTIVLLKDSKWSKLNLNERIDVLQCICDVEVDRLGINKNIHLYASNLEEDILGSYNDESASVQISLYLLEDNNSYEVLNTVLHEVYHAAQNCYVKAYHSLKPEFQNLSFLNKAYTYSEEFENYKSGPNLEYDDFLAYYNQTCERDARIYAEYEAEYYYEIIDTYIKQEETVLHQEEK